MQRKLLVLAALMLGCGPDLPPIEYSSERVDIGATTARPCRGDLDWLDAHVSFVERKLNITGPDKVELYLFDSRDDLPCSLPVAGCYNSDGYIASLWPAVGHELVHSVARDVEFSSRFWSEGVAEAYSGAGNVRGDHAPLEPDHFHEQESSRVDYNNAGHLTRYIEREFGDEAVMAVARGANTQEALGLTAPQLIDEHRADEAFSIPARSPCDHDDLEQVEAGVWTGTEAFTCGDPDVSQFEWDGITLARRVTLPTDGRYRIEVEGGTGVLVVGCHLEDLPEEPDPVPSNGDLLNQADGVQTAFGTFFESGSPHEVEATEGTYRLALTVPDDDLATPITVTVTAL